MSLVELYKEIADMTAPLCAGDGKGACRCPRSCCDESYCGIAIEYSKAKYGVDLVPLVGTKLPFMGSNGCILEPHYRPVCSVHVCCVNNLGTNPQDAEWANKYFDLRDKIDEVEFTFL